MLRPTADCEPIATGISWSRRGHGPARTGRFGAIYERVDIATGEISASFDQTPPAGLAPKSVVFVFEDKDKGKYLGEFSVTSVNQNKVKLKPATTLQEEINVIAKSRGPWVLYEVMPIDSHTLFTEQEPSVLKALMPGVSADALAEFTRDGKPAKYDPTKDAKDQPQGNDPPDRVQVKVRFTKDSVPPSDPLARKRRRLPPRLPPASHRPVVQPPQVRIRLKRRLSRRATRPTSIRTPHDRWSNLRTPHRKSQSSRRAIRIS